MRERMKLYCLTYIFLIVPNIVLLINTLTHDECHLDHHAEDRFVKYMKTIRFDLRIILVNYVNFDYYF